SIALEIVHDGTRIRRPTRHRDTGTGAVGNGPGIVTLGATDDSREVQRIDRFKCLHDEPPIWDLVARCKGIYRTSARFAPFAMRGVRFPGVASQIGRESSGRCTPWETVADRVVVV